MDSAFVKATKFKEFYLVSITDISKP